MKFYFIFKMLCILKYSCKDFSVPKLKVHVICASRKKNHLPKTFYRRKS